MKKGIKSLLAVAIFGSFFLLSGCGSGDDVVRQDRYGRGGGNTMQPRDERGRYEKSTEERPVIYKSERK